MAKGPTKNRFEQIYRDGKRAAGKLCRISALPGKGFIGFATARKIGNRPYRNRVRRRFQEAVKRGFGCTDSQMDYVVIIGVAGAEASLDQITAETAGLLTELRERWAKESESF